MYQKRKREWQFHPVHFSTFGNRLTIHHTNFFHHADPAGLSLLCRDDDLKRTVSLNCDPASTSSWRTESSVPTSKPWAVAPTLDSRSLRSFRGSSGRPG